MLSAGYLVIAGALGTILLMTASTETDPVQGGNAQQIPLDFTPTVTRTPARTSSPPSTTPTTTRTTSASALPQGFRRVSTQAGMTTVIPAGWQVVPCASGNGCEQSTDPADSERFLRFGGSPSPPTDLLSGQTTYEQQFSQRTGYQRLRFESGSYHGFPSVEWEFEWVSAGVRRHVRVLYWRAAGDDNLVYASSTSDRWPQTQPVYQAMIANSTP
ncbi:MAG: hypothetical protein ABW215_20940 [Kibdelosporangium sp.]